MFGFRVDLVFIFVRQTDLRGDPFSVTRIVYRVECTGVNMLTHLVEISPDVSRSRFSLKAGAVTAIRYGAVLRAYMECLQCTYECLSRSYHVPSPHERVRQSLSMAFLVNKSDTLVSDILFLKTLFPWVDLHASVLDLTLLVGRGLVAFSI